MKRKIFTSLSVLPRSSLMIIYRLQLSSSFIQRLNINPDHPMHASPFTWVYQLSSGANNVLWRLPPRSGAFSYSGRGIQLFRQGDFLTLPPGPDGTISVHLEDFRFLLKQKIPQLAVDRCRKAVIRYRQRIGYDEA